MYLSCVELPYFMDMIIIKLFQVRDIMKGTLKFSRNMLDSDDIVINDNHYLTETHDNQLLLPK